MNNESTKIHSALLYLRLFVGIVLIAHIIGQLHLYNASTAGYPALLFGNSAASLIITTILEAILAVMIMCGVWVRFAALVMAIGTFVDIFIVYPALGWAGVERQILFVGLYIFLVVAGAGRYSYDWRAANKKEHEISGTAHSGAGR